MTRSVESVLVSGAGPAGLTFALEAADAIHDMRIIDKKILGQPTFSRASGIQPRVFPILDKLGVFERVRSEARNLKGNKLYVDGTLVKQVEFQDEITGKYPLTIDQFRLEQLFLNAFKEKGYAVEEEKEAVELVEDKRVYGLRIKDIPSGTEEMVHTQAIVACDGSASPLRKRSGILFQGQTYAENSFVSDCQLLNPFDRDYMQYHTSGDLRLVIVPLPQNNCYRVSGCTHPDNTAEPEEVIRDLFRRMVHEAPMELKVAHFSYYKINSRVAHTYNRKNLFLCGDAAHVYPPNGGQGLNSAVEDAYYLGNLFREGHSLAAIKKQYAKKRNDAIRMLEQTTGTKMRYTSKHILKMDAREESRRIQQEEL